MRWGSSYRPHGGAGTLNLCLANLSGSEPSSLHLQVARDGLACPDAGSDAVSVGPAQVTYWMRDRTIAMHVSH